MNRYRTFFRTFLLAAVLALVFTAMPVLAAQEKNLIVASAKTSGRTLVLHWNGVSEATQYTVYRSVYKEGESAPAVRKVKTVKGTTYRESGLEKGYDYSYRVAAYKGDKRLCISPLAITYAGSRTLTGKAVSVTPEGTGLGVIVGKVVSAKCIVKTDNGKKQERGVEDLRYYSNDPKIATVDSNGNVTGMSVGNCRIYMVAVNGVNAWTQVSVLEAPKETEPATETTQTATSSCSACAVTVYPFTCGGYPVNNCGYGYPYGYRPWAPSGERAYTVTFDPRNGGTVSSQVVVAGTSAAEPETDPSRDGFKFIGWFTAPDGGTLFDFGKTPVNSNLVLFARYEKT